MPADNQAKQHVHDLVNRLGPAQAAVVLSEQDIRAIEASRGRLRENPGVGVSFEELVTGCGFTMDQVLGYKD